MKQKIIYGLLFAVILWLGTYIVINEPKVKAGDEILDLQMEIQRLKDSIEDHKENYHIADAEQKSCKLSCDESWGSLKEREHEEADSDRADLEAAEEKLGLILQRQLQ